MSGFEWVTAVAVTLLTLVSYLRWWRVAQREHYEPGRVLAMIGIWCRATPVNAVWLVAAVAFSLLGFLSPIWAVVGAVWWLVWPLGLSLRSRTSKLAFTTRMKRLAAVTVVLHLVLAVVLGLLGAVTLLPLLVPLVTELGLLATRPVERSLSRKFQVSAAAKMKKLQPRVVAITGSYGKTSTKNYAAHLMSGRYSVMASPASFNNVLGLSRAVNDRLDPGTDVFVAEMGTYGPGEIARLCEMFPPEVSAIVSIGEAHLERMKSRETIVRAKSEILPPARTVVLNVDVPELAAAADQYQSAKRVIRCSVEGAPGADVVVRRAGTGWEVVLGEETFAVDLPAETGHPINVAIAIGLALAVDVPRELILDRLASVPGTAHRAEATTLANGLVVIDDTYNANPDGAAAAVARARELVADGGTVWTVTPGMVELGHAQAERNADLARAATAEPWMQLCVIGATNRAALGAGAADRTHAFPSREKAVEHVMAAAGAGDVVLYENDLPDHYP